MKEVGKVIKKSGERSDIEIKKSSACAKCGLCAFNDAGVFTIEASDRTSSVPGDYVEVEVPGKDVLVSAFLIFIFPLIIFFTGYILLGIIFGTVLLAVYLPLLYLFDRSRKTIPRVIRILSNR